MAEDGVTWVRYEYDAANRLKRVIRDSDNVELQQFGHASSNARFQSLDSQTGQWTLYASVAGTTLAEYTEYTITVPVWTKSYTYLGDSQLSTITPNGTSAENTEYNHPDRLGTKLVTNQQTGTATEQATLPFGRPLDAESTLTTNNKRFTSYDRSQITKLDYAVNRTYDSKLGRFTQVDPIGINGSSLESPQSLNLYVYCANDPINYADPSGLFFGKLFKWIGQVIRAVTRILKWVAIVVAVVLVTALILAYTPYMLPAWLGDVIGSLIGVASSVIGGLSSFVGTLAGTIGVEVTLGATAGKIIAAALFGVGVIASHLRFAADEKTTVFDRLKAILTRLPNPLKLLKCSDALIQIAGVVLSCGDAISPDCIKAVLEAVRPLGDCLEEAGYGPLAKSLQFAADALQKFSETPVAIPPTPPKLPPNDFPTGIPTSTPKGGVRPKRPFPDIRGGPTGRTGRIPTGRPRGQLPGKKN